MLRTRSWIAAAVMALAMLGMASGAQAIMCDCNQDGTISVLDALELQRILSGLIPEPSPIDDCDIDSSGTLTVLDALMLAQFFSGSRPGLCPALLTSEDWTKAPVEDAATDLCEANVREFELFEKSDPTDATAGASKVLFQRDVRLTS